MKKLVTLIPIVTLSIFLFSCGGGTSSGTSLDLNGIWRVNQHFTSASVTASPFTGTLKQTGNTVVSTGLVEVDPSPGTVSCSTDAPVVQGTTANNTFNGIFTTSTYTSTFSVSGTSTALSGTFSVNFHSGPCASAGLLSGTVTMAKL